jgi:hypothetical protein
VSDLNAIWNLPWRAFQKNLANGIGVSSAPTDGARSVRVQPFTVGGIKAGRSALRPCLNGNATPSQSWMHRVRRGLEPLAAV